MTKEELFYTEVCRRADEQHKTRQHFDTMAIGVLGFAAVLLGLTPFAALDTSSHIIYPTIAIGIAFIFVSVSTILGLWLRNWEFQPNLSDLDNSVESSEYGDTEIIFWSAKWMADAIANNKKQLRIKAICLRIAYISLSFEALCLIVIFSLGISLCP